ncbi:MAG: class I SAM-dependent methyltransferase [Actinobacteria bacterium]|nr:class I SAM-dependent methyltransferase [Actinomycetota bacterium]
MRIIKYLNSINPHSKLNILDVGCSKGYVGEKFSGPNFTFYGIDISKTDAKIASKYYRQVKIVDLDVDKIPYPPKFFDVIILADVAEHLKNPLKTVSSLKPLLKKGGVLIISTVNIANLYIRLRLLFGKFDYQEKGILDKTHLKLFTLKTFRNLAIEPGFKVIREEFTPIPLPLIDDNFSQGKPLYIFHLLNYLFAYLLPTLFCFQFILYCQKNDQNS